MRCPTLAELPTPPAGRTGWPWTEESPRLPEHKPDGTAWPRISIVTPSLNQGEFLEEAIRSALLQGYPNLELIIMDGGSRDQTLEIIHKYQEWISKFASETDRGQSHAINKGWQAASGEILAWLNADDLYTAEAYRMAAQTLIGEVIMTYSGFSRIDRFSRVTRRFHSKSFSLPRLLCETNAIPQPTVFLRRSLYEEIGFLNESLDYTMDLEYWLRIGLRHGTQAIASRRIQHLEESSLACFRLQPGSKSTRQIEEFSREREIIWNWFYSLRDLPAEAVKVKGEAFAFMYYQRALASIRRRGFRSGLSYLRKVSAASPAYLLKKPARLLRLPLQAVLSLGPRLETQLSD